MNRAEAIDKIEYIIDNGQDYGYWTDAQKKALNMAIEALQERPQGKWIRRSSVGNWECSLCGGDVITTEPKLANYDYCPYCGAKMESD